MKRTFARSSTIAAAVCIHFASSAARADDIVQPSSSLQPVAESESGGPSRDLMHTGPLTLGASYVPALIVIESDVDADQRLYAPLAGPLDLSTRERCEAECSAETVNEALPAADGIFQALGALQILGSFIQPETSALTISEAEGSLAISFRVQPTRIRRGSGLIAVASF